MRKSKQGAGLNVNIASTHQSTLSMRVNQETVLVGEKVVLVPYRPEHVPKYHSWMQDEELRRLTASEPLSLKEEYEMQQKWQLDEDKLTFIILYKLDNADLSTGVLVQPSDSRIALLPMVGDVNVFLHGTRQSLNEDHQVKEARDMMNDEQDGFELEAEVEIMIAEPAYRRHGLAYEALQLMLGYVTGTPELFTDQRHYYSSPLRLPSRSLMTRITESNVPSINLFKKLGFRITKTVPVFEEVEMRWERHDDSALSQLLETTELTEISTEMPFSSGEHLQQIDSDLYSVQSVHAIISAISSRRVVRKLILDHNELDDSGCVILFQFLSSETGRRYEINEINLNYNYIGELGLTAIAAYLSGNQALRGLFLQNNNLTVDSNIAKVFADAVNSSHLEVLTLPWNQQMSDTFIEGFLQTLTSNHLRGLDISRMDITPRSLPTIVDYLSSRRCKLSILICNDNPLGLHAVKSIIRTVEQHNYSLTSIELHSNHLIDSDEDREDHSMMNVRKDCNLAIKQILARNEQLGRETQRQALKLLCHARTVLLHMQANVSTEKRTSICAPSGGRLNDVTMSNNKSCFHFLQLPLEIQFHILSFLSPVLSLRQCTEIYHYAIIPTTLPPLLPRLVGSTIDQRRTNQSVAVLYRGRRVSQQHDSSRAKEKYQWLANVDCMVYEPSG